MWPLLLLILSHVQRLQLYNTSFRNLPSGSQTTTNSPGPTFSLACYLRLVRARWQIQREIRDIYRDIQGFKVSATGGNVCNGNFVICSLYMVRHFNPAIYADAVHRAMFPGLTFDSAIVNYAAPANSTAKTDGTFTLSTGRVSFWILVDCRNVRSNVISLGISKYILERVQWYAIYLR